MGFGVRLAETVRLSFGVGLAAVLVRRDHVIASTTGAEQVVISPHPARALIWAGFDFDLVWRKKMVTALATCALRELRGDDMRAARQRIARQLV